MAATTPTILLEEMTRDDARAAFDAGAIVVVPTGSIEQHGPHLPLAVDTLVVTHIAREAAVRVTGKAPVVVAPAMHFGVSHHHMAFAGTLSLTSHLYVEALKELVRGLYHHGVRRIVLLNGHGGNEHPNGTVVQALVHEEGLPVVIAQASYWTVARDALVAAGARDVAPGFPGHAGGFETSLTMALRPDLVKLDRRRAPLAPIHPVAHATKAGAFQRAGGTSDDASGADAAAGQRLLEAAVEAVADYLVTFHQSTGEFTAAGAGGAAATVTQAAREAVAAGGGR
jgi:creatinine amidohydrolase